MNNYSSFPIKYREKYLCLWWTKSERERKRKKNLLYEYYKGWRYLNEKDKKVLASSISIFSCDLSRDFVTASTLGDEKKKKKKFSVYNL
jgi:hypothetical protein